MDNAELAIGIDLGTTNSLIAVWKDGAAQLIPNKFGEYLTPSIISMDENNHILVGKPAVSRRTSHPDKTAALFKRAMGSNTNWRLGSDTFNAPELSSLVLRSLKEDAEEFLQRPIKDVVISVPASRILLHFRIVPSTVGTFLSGNFMIKFIVFIEQGHKARIFVFQTGY